MLKLKNTEKWKILRKGYTEKKKKVNTRASLRELKRDVLLNMQFSVRMAKFFEN